MDRRHTLEVSPPNIRGKSITLDRSKFIQALAKAVLTAIPAGLGLAAGIPAPGNMAKLGTHIVELVASLGLKTTKEALASELIFAAANTAALELVQEAASRGDSENRSPTASVAELYALLEQPDPKDLIAMLEGVLTEQPLSIDIQFFKRPTEYLPVATIADVLSQWLDRLGLRKTHTTNVANRFKHYFIYAIYNNWHSDAKKYAVLIEALECPFDDVLEKTMAWERYWAHLQRDIQLPMMAESFGLDAVYVPLRAYFITKDCPDDDCKKTVDVFRRPQESRQAIITQHVVELDHAVDTWRAQSDKNDAIRLLCGGPGSGKSSFAKKLAARLAENKFGSSTFEMEFTLGCNRRSERRSGRSW